MYRQIVDAFGGFHDGFRDGWVSVHYAAEFVRRGFERHGDAGFGKQFGGVRADDVDAEDFVVFLFGDYFDEAVGFANLKCKSITKNQSDFFYRFPRVVL